MKNNFVNIFKYIYIFNACSCDILYSAMYIVTLKCACSVICFCYKIVILQRFVEVKALLSLCFQVIYIRRKINLLCLSMSIRLYATSALDTSVVLESMLILTY